MDSTKDQVYYNYLIKNLTKDVESIDDLNKYNEIILCVYTINTTGKYPFIKYLLSNNEVDDKLSLPVLKVYKEFNKNELKFEAKVFLSNMLEISLDELKRKIEFDGFHEYKQNLYLFFDTTKCQINKYKFCLHSLRFALIDEIINHSCVLNNEISYETKQFFVNNDFTIFLYDKKNEVFETPIVGFVDKQTPAQLNFVFTFGESSKNKSAILGPYYYFYTNFIRKNTHSTGGIVRFALFTGNSKYIENVPTGQIDDSDIKKQRLEDKSLNRNYEIQTLRISDHDGIWANTYDSAYLGNIELDDGSFVEETSMVVLKEYNQQTPLSYHYINTKNNLKGT
jgi:hypothetical protein